MKIMLSISHWKLTHHPSWLQLLLVALLGPVVSGNIFPFYSIYLSHVFSYSFLSLKAYATLFQFPTHLDFSIFYGSGNVVRLSLVSEPNMGYACRIIFFKKGRLF